MTIHTTHVGSLPRSQEVVDFIFAREHQTPYDQAAFDAALAQRRELFGDDHPAVAEVLTNYALLVSYGGAYDAAETMFTQALAIYDARDEGAGFPGAVTGCPLCNSAITFFRRVAGDVLTFGVSGKLRNSDMVRYDRETESWGQQAIGEGIVGLHMGTDLVELPTWVESYASFSARTPDGLVMAEPDFNRPYGRHPYVNYDSSVRPFLYNGEMPPHGIDPLARVVRVGARAWPLTRLAEAGEVSEEGVTLSWTAGQASALDSPEIADGRDIGNIRVQDTSGADLPHDVMFAFAYHAFWPEGDWMLGN